MKEVLPEKDCSFHSGNTFLKRGKEKKKKMRKRKRKQKMKQKKGIVYF